MLHPAISNADLVGSGDSLLSGDVLAKGRKRVSSWLGCGGALETVVAVSPLRLEESKAASGHSVCWLLTALATEEGQRQDNVGAAAVAPSLPVTEHYHPSSPYAPGV